MAVPIEADHADLVMLYLRVPSLQLYSQDLAVIFCISILLVAGIIVQI